MTMHVHVIFPSPPLQLLLCYDSDVALQFLGGYAITLNSNDLIM